MIILVSSITEVSMNKIALSIRVCADDWIIASTVALNYHYTLLFLSSGIVIGVLVLAVLIAGGVFVAIKGVPDPVKNVFSNTKEAADASVQFQHSNLDTPPKGDL